MHSPLIYIVTLFGFFLSALSFVVVFRGKRIPGEGDSTQELEFRGFKMKTNAVVMLLTVSAIVTVLPLSLQAWLESLHARTVTPTQPVLPLKIYITGQVLDSAGPVEGAKVTVVNMKDVKPGDSIRPLEVRVTDGSGTFDFPALSFGEGDRYKVVAAKENHVEQYFYMGPSGAVDVRTVLVAKRKNGGEQ